MRAIGFSSLGRDLLDDVVCDRVDLVVCQDIGERGHRSTAIADLGLDSSQILGDGRFLQIRSDTSPCTVGPVARLAVVAEELSATRGLTVSGLGSG